MEGPGSDETDGLITVATVVAAHGVKGELRIKPLLPKAEVPAFTEEVASSFETIRIGERDFDIRGEVRAHKGTVLVKLKGIARKEDVEPLIGLPVMVPGSMLPALAEGEHYGFELMGLKVVTDSGELLGIVEGIVSTGANDVLEVGGQGDYEGETLLIPVIEDVMVKVDTRAKKITIHPLEGLLPERGAGGD